MSQALISPDIVARARATMIISEPFGGRPQLGEQRTRRGRGELWEASSDDDDDDSDQRSAAAAAVVVVAERGPIVIDQPLLLALLPLAALTPIQRRSHARPPAAGGRRPDGAAGSGQVATWLRGFSRNWREPWAGQARAAGAR